MAFFEYMAASEWLPRAFSITAAFTKAAGFLGSRDKAFL